MSDTVVTALLAIGAIFVLAAAAGAVLEWKDITVPPITEPFWRWVVAGLGVAALATGVIGAWPDPGPGPDPKPLPTLTPTTQPDQSPTTVPPATSPSTSPSAPPSTSPISDTNVTSGPGSIARQGTLTVRAFVAVNLDSTSADWGAVQGDWKGIRNFEWDGGPTDLMIAGAPGTTAVLGSAAPSDYTACTTAQMGVWPADGKGLYVGQRFCVQTGKHMVLLDIKAVKQSVNGSPATLTMDATVWNES